MRKADHSAGRVTAAKLRTDIKFETQAPRHNRRTGNNSSSEGNGTVPLVTGVSCSWRQEGLTPLRPHYTALRLRPLECRRCCCCCRPQTHCLQCPLRTSNNYALLCSLNELQPRQPADSSRPALNMSADGCCQSAHCSCANCSLHHRRYCLRLRLCTYSPPPPTHRQKEGSNTSRLLLLPPPTPSLPHLDG